MAITYTPTPSSVGQEVQGSNGITYEVLDLSPLVVSPACSSTTATQSLSKDTFPAANFNYQPLTNGANGASSNESAVSSSRHDDFGIPLTATQMRIPKAGVYEVSGDCTAEWVDPTAASPGGSGTYGFRFTKNGTAIDGIGWTEDDFAELGSSGINRRKGIRVAFSAVAGDLIRVQVFVAATGKVRFGKVKGTLKFLNDNT